MAAVKLDENVPDSVAAILRDAGHDVALARDQQLAGVADERLLATAAGEGRALLTLDRDFTNILRHPPGRAAGIVVLRPKLQTLPATRRLARVVSEHLKLESPSRRLWVIDESKIRICRGDLPDGCSAERGNRSRRRERSEARLRGLRSDSARRARVADSRRGAAVTPVPSPQHQRASKRLQRQLEAFFEASGKGEVFDAPIDLILGPHDVTQPGVAVVTP